MLQKHLSNARWLNKLQVPLLIKELFCRWRGGDSEVAQVVQPEVIGGGVLSTNQTP
jgi:hypothetical protein